MVQERANRLDHRAIIGAPSRRSFLKGLGLLMAAPAIVRAASLMPVKAMPDAGALALISNDQITAIRILDAGSGYTSLPVVTIEKMLVYGNEEWEPIEFTGFKALRDTLASKAA